MITRCEQEFVFHTELTDIGFLCSTPGLSPVLGAPAKGEEGTVFRRGGSGLARLRVLRGERRRGGTVGELAI